MSFLVSDMGFLLGQNIVLGLAAAVSGTGWITSQCSTILWFSSRKKATIAITNKVPLRSATLQRLPKLQMIAVAATGYDKSGGTLHLVEANTGAEIAVMDRRKWLLRLIYVRLAVFSIFVAGEGTRKIVQPDIFILLAVVYGLSACWFVLLRLKVPSGFSWSWRSTPS